MTAGDGAYGAGRSLPTYKIACPLCEHVVKCHDSMSDARQELDDHLLRVHPDQPDPTPDPRFPS